LEAVLFNQKKCIEAFIEYLSEAYEDPERPIELHLSDGTKIFVPVKYDDPERSEENGKVIHLKLKPRMA
jgi:hypothetical protein